MDHKNIEDNGGYVMKKKVILGVGILVCAIAVISGVIYHNTQFDLKINSNVVESDEYLYVMNQQIYDVTKNSNQTIDSEFWGKEADGMVPYKVLADSTIEKLKYNRAVYENAKQQGYVDEIDYKHIVERMENENKMRKEKIAQGEPVYGLSEFTIPLFMEYEMDTFQKRYCENLDNKGMQITDEEREQYYEENKDLLFVKNDDLIIDYIKVDYTLDQLDEQQLKDIQSEMVSIYKSMDERNTLQVLAEKNEMLSQYFSHEEIFSGSLTLVFDFKFNKAFI